jgi:hypothetical protein
MYLSSNRTLNDTSNPTPQNKATETNVSTSAMVFVEALGKNLAANAVMSLPLVIRMLRV